MLFRLLADVVVVVHLAFIAFVLLGGLLVMRWRKVAWVHLPIAAYGAAIEIWRWICPLTPLENELRHRGGEAGYAGGFVPHYVLPVLYPAKLPPAAPWVLAGIVLVLNIGLYAAVVVRWRHEKRGGGTPGSLPLAPRRARSGA